MTPSHPRLFLQLNEYKQVTLKMAHFTPRNKALAHRAPRTQIENKGVTRACQIDEAYLACPTRVAKRRKMKAAHYASDSKSAALRSANCASMRLHLKLCRPYATGPA
jgi:hypothetical protein